MHLSVTCLKLRSALIVLMLFKSAMGYIGHIWCISKILTDKILFYRFLFYIRALGLLSAINTFINTNILFMPLTNTLYMYVCIYFILKTFYLLFVCIILFYITYLMHIFIFISFQNENFWGFIYVKCLFFNVGL